IAPRPMSEVVTEEYLDNVLALWQLAGAVGEDGESATSWLHFSAEADHTMREFESWLEPKLAEDGELFHLAGLANKLAGATARIAGILHMAEAVGGQRQWGTPIRGETAAAAIRLGRDYLLPHARAAFGMMGADERLGDIRRLVAWLANSVNSVNS